MKANSIEYLKQEYEASKATPFEMDAIPNPRQALSASSMPSASVSKAQTLADEFSVPRYMALDAIPELENESIAKRVERDKGLTEWVNQDIGNASFVRENTDAFIYAGDRITGLTMGENPNEPLSFWGNTALSYDIGNLVAESGEIGHALMSATDEAHKAELLARRKVVRENLQAAQKQRGELAFGHIGYAAEQLPLFLGSIDERLNMIADITPWLFTAGMGQGAIAGGALGGTAGSIIPGAGTAAGGASGATAGAIAGGLRGLGMGLWGGFLGGGAEHSYKLESGLFYDEFLDEKDLNEQAIPQDVLRTFATLYGIGASAIEMGGEAAFLKVLDLTGLPKALGKDAGKKALKGYIVEAMKDKSLQPILVEFAKKVTSGAAISGVEEMAQAFMSNVAEMGMKEYVANKYGTQFDDVSLTEGVVEEGIAGVSGGLWFAGGGATMRALYDGNKVRKYQKFAENSHAIFDQLEDLKGNVPAPVVESYLNTKFKDSLGQDVYLPANALLELYQSDVDLITPLNLDAVQVKQAAELGQDIPVTTSHAMANLDKAAFEQFTNIARVDAEGANAFDLQNYEIQTAEDNDRIQDLIVEWDDEQNAIDYEVDVFRQSLTANVESLPQLRLQAATYGGVEQFVNTQVELLTRMASRLAERSQGSTTVSKILQKLSFSDQPILNAMATQEQQQVDEASYAQQQEVMGYVWGKLDRDQVRSMYGDEGVDNLEMLYGRGIFAGAKRAPRLATIERKVASGEMTREEAVQAMSAQGEVTKVNFDSTAQELSDLYLIDGRGDINPTDALYEYLVSGNNFYTKDNRGRKRDLDKRRNRPTVSRQGLFQGDGTQRLAPNGKPSNLTPELWETVRSDEFIAWFGDWQNDPENASKVVDENGEPMVVYHGSVATFDTFNKDFAEAEGNLGKSFYFTNQYSDVEDNYRGGGPDYTNKIQRRAEMELEDDAEIEAQVERLTEDAINNASLLETFLNIKNPVYIGENETNLDINYFIENYLDADDYITDIDVDEDAYYETQEAAFEYIKFNMIEDVIDKADIDYNYTDDISGAVFNLIAEDNLTYESLRESLNELYIEDNNGDMAASEVVRAFFEAAGFDGVIDTTVSEKFKNMGLDEDTSHYGIFEPNQIKSIENQGTFSAESDNIYYQSQQTHQLVEIESAYNAAIAENDMGKARDLVIQYAALKGYTTEDLYRMSHSAPNSKDELSVNLVDFATDNHDLMPHDFFEHPDWYISLREQRKSFNAISKARSEILDGSHKKITVHRAVPNDVEGLGLRNGDWVSPDKAYAKLHGEKLFGGNYKIISQKVEPSHLWWNADSIDEWGFDDGQDYAYQNTENNIKSIDPVTYTNINPETGKKGHTKYPIPLSQRFDASNPSIYYQFIGEQGAARLDAIDEASVRMDNLTVAREMEKTKDPLTVKMATGWERGADGKWRYEVGNALNDNSTTYIESKIQKYSGDREYVFLLKDILSEDVLNAYGKDLGWIAVYFQEMEGYQGSYVNKEITIKPSNDINSIIETFEHEIQHAIQEIEGFARGGNIEEFSTSPERYGLEKALDYHRNRIDNAKKEIGYDDYISQSVAKILNGEIDADQHFEQLEKFVEDSKHGKIIKESEERIVSILSKLGNLGKPYDKYRSLAGEVEARNSEARIGMTLEERRKSLAVDTEDVAREDQLIIESAKNDVNMMMSAPQGLQPKGRIEAQDDGTYMISLFDDANLSTVVHEMSHFFFLEMQELDRMGLADESLQADLQTLRGWLGMKDGEDFTLEKTFGKDEESRKKRFIGRQEKLARGMELYLREGKAPVSSLRSVFSRFAIWLKHVYKQAVELGVKLNPEVKEVFDRMIATEREINMAKSKAGIVPFTGQEISSLGFTDTMKKLLEKFEMAVGNEAEQIIFSARTQARDKLRDKITKEETARINGMPIVKVRDDIRASGMNKEDVESIMGEDFARDMSNKIPTGLRRNAGKSPQELAVEHGFDDVKTMLSELMLLSAKKDMVNARVEERLAYEDSEFVAEDVLFETKAMGEYESLMAEQLLSKIQGGDDPQAVPAAKPISNQSIKTLAWSYLREMPMKSVLRTYNFIAAARKAHRLEREALSKGDYAKALEHNTQVRLNIALIQESRRINKDIEALKKRADKFILNTKAHPVARYFVNDIAARMGFQTKNTRLAGGKSVADIQEWANSVEMQTTPSLLGGARFYKDVTLEQFNVFADEVNAIIHLERAERKIETAQGLIDMETHAENISASIAENAGFKARKALAQENKVMHEVKRFFASLLKIDTIARMLDGDKIGIVYDSIVQPINDAYVKYNDMMAKVKKDLEGIFAVYTSKELKAFKDKKFIIQGFSAHETWTKEQVLAFALNVGNEGNMERLKNSYLEYDGLGRGEGGRLSDEQIQAVLDTLDKRDWDFIQSVWDYFEVYSKDSFDLEEKMTGVRPIKVEATQVYTPFGYYRGGYFPVVYDTAKSGNAPRDVNEDPSKKVFAVASVPHNSMKERKGVGLSGVPLKLSLDNIPQNIAKTVHNLAMREPVKNVAKVLRNNTVRSAIQGAGGVVQYKEIQDWLVDVAGGTPFAFGGADAFWRWARSSQSLMSMGFKVTTLLAQVSGMIHAMPELGVGHTLKGALHVVANLPRMGELIDETYARSGMMRHRVRSVDREVNDFSNDVMKKGGMSGWAKDNAFVPMGYVQLLASDMPVWWGAYQKGLKDYAGEEQKAVKFADSMVEMTQSAGQKKDLARIQRGGEAQKMFTMYYTFFSAMYQMMYRRGVNIARNPKDIKNWFALANYVLVGMVLNNMVNEYLLGRGYDEEEDESFLEWAVKSNLMFAAQGVPVLRDVINGLFGDYGYSFTPAASGVETIIRAALKVNKSLNEDEEFDAKDVAISSAKALGYFTSNPLLGAQTTNSARELWDYLDGTDPEFEAWRIIMGAKNDN